MITNLNSMTDFVMQQAERPSIGLIDYTYGLIRNYALFLQQKPTLSMFIACVDGVPVSVPIPATATKEEYDNYQKAQGNVLFAGFVISRNDERETEICFEGVILSFYKRSNMWFDDTNGNPVQFTTLEDLTSYNLPLTPKSQQIIYGK